VTVRLTVSDGQASATETVTLVKCLALDPGRTPGTVRIDAPAALEFAAVPLGTSAARTFTVYNTSTEPTSQLRVRVGLEGTGFSLSATDLDIGPGGNAPVTLTFAPGGEGHASARVAVAACAANRSVVHLLGHGFGGQAAGNGPTLADATVYFNAAGTAIGGILPSGQRFDIDTNVPTCETPSGGSGTGDVCVQDADCAENGGICQPARPTSAEWIEFCGDGSGDLYLITDEDSYTDPSGAETERTVTVLRLDLDANGARTGAQVLARETAGTTQITCDGLSAGAGGRVYTAEFRNVNVGDECFRSEQEALIALRKGNGASTALLGRIDAAAKVDLCEDDIHQVLDVKAAAEGQAIFASLIEDGLYRIRPTPLEISPSIQDAFQLHPDGSVLYATAADVGTRGLLTLYKLSPSQAALGVLHLEEQIPCATFSVPSNIDPGQQRAFFVGENSMAVSRGAPDAVATVLVSFITTGGITGQEPVLSSNLATQGVVVFRSPPGATACEVAAVVTLDRIFYLTF
jgi:hypothetical protein